MWLANGRTWRVLNSKSLGQPLRQKSADFEMRALLLPMGGIGAAVLAGKRCPGDERIFRELAPRISICYQLISLEPCNCRQWSHSMKLGACESREA